MKGQRNKTAKTRATMRRATMRCATAIGYVTENNRTQGQLTRPTIGSAGHVKTMYIVRDRKLNTTPKTATCATDIRGKREGPRSKEKSKIGIYTQERRSLSEA